MNDRDAPEVDEISHLWSTVVVLPHVERLDDDDMDVQFPEYDGRCSLQTRQAIVKLGATGLELDTNWALTPRIWSCPPSGTSRRGRRMPLPGCGLQDQDQPRANISASAVIGVRQSRLPLHIPHRIGDPGERKDILRRIASLSAGY